MELASKYDPKEVEGKWYQYWLDHKLFSSKPDGREPYTIVIPPPNVTGVLHMGHMLNNTIQDILVRRARMEGKNALWVPGTDHASIATEAKVVKKLAGEGIKKRDLIREQFLEHAWDWTHEHGGIILKQLRRLGASCDWDRTAFTMDEKRSESVIKVFVDLYNKGLIYRGLRMVNWDPKALTALSTEEVIYKEEQSHLFHLKYYVADLKALDNEEALKAEGNIIHKDEKGYYAVVATTRPETIMGDTAMLVSPVPGMLKELLACQVVLLDALLSQLLHHFGLSSDRGVIGARYPAGVLALHAGTTHQDVLNGVVQHVTHVQHTRNIGRRNNDCVGFTSIWL